MRFSNILNGVFNKAMLIIMAMPFVYGTALVPAHETGKSVADFQTPDETGFKIFKDGLNRSVLIPVKPFKIVAIAAADVEILFTLGAGETLVGIPDSVKYPEAAQEIARIGGMYGNFNAEKIVEKDPDLVLLTMSNWALYGSNLDQLEKNKLTVLGFPYPDTLDEILSHIITLCNIIGSEHKAQAVCDDLKKRVKRILEKTERLSHSQRPKVYTEWVNAFPGSGGNTTSGNNTRTNTLIEMAGGVNIFRDINRRSFIAGNEEIISRNPEVIILTADLKKYSVQGLQQAVKTRPGLNKTDAVLNNRVYIVEEQVTWANPRIVSGLEAFAHCLHPELFKDHSK